MLLLSVTSFFHPPSVVAAPQVEINFALLKELADYPEDILGTEWCNVDAKHQELWVSAVYNNSGKTPLWVSSNGPDVRAKLVVSALKKVSEDGLNPEEYATGLIESLWERRTAESLQNSIFI